MKYRKTARPLSFLVASLLAFQPVTALAVTFADMNQVPWPGAEVSINKAADLGLVVGETKNGKSYFRPRDTVSLSESCQFAYKVLLQTKKASADASVTEKWATVLNTYKIQDWALTISFFHSFCHFLLSGKRDHFHFRPEQFRKKRHQYARFQRTGCGNSWPRPDSWCSLL